MKAQDKVPLQAIFNKGPLKVPFQLSLETANNLQAKGFIALEEIGASKAGRSIHYRVHLTDTGLALLMQEINA